MSDGMHNTILLQGLGLLCLLALAAAANLSDYVTPCKSKDPELNECVRRAAQQVLEKSSKGFPDLGVPAMDPAKIPALAIDRTGALAMSLSFSNSTHQGLGSTVVKSARVDPVAHVYNFSVVIPKYAVDGIYDVNGRVILLPITGHGKANITFTDIETEWSFTGQKATKDGQDYLKLTKLETSIHPDSPKNVQVHFDGLFGGNKILGDTMNDFLNQNWKEIVKQLKPGVQASFDRRLLPVAQRFMENFPLKQLFDDQ